MGWHGGQWKKSLKSLSRAWSLCLKRKIIPLRSKRLPLGKGKPSTSESKRVVGIDLKAICSIDHECRGCSEVSESCCAKYDVCVSEEGLKKIIPYLPEAAKFCPHLKTDDGFANVFEKAEKGVYAIDTHDNGLCVFAYEANGLIRCSLHTIEKNLDLPLGTIKPEVCILWPLTFSDSGDVLTLHDDALSCACSSPREIPSIRISPDLLKTIQHFGGETST